MVTSEGRDNTACMLGCLLSVVCSAVLLYWICCGKHVVDDPTFIMEELNLTSALNYLGVFCFACDALVTSVGKWYLKIRIRQEFEMQIFAKGLVLKLGF